MVLNWYSRMGHYNGTTMGARGCSRKRAPDGATAGTAVVGASVGERVTAQTTAQRWMQSTTEPM